MLVAPGPVSPPSRRPRVLRLAGLLALPLVLVGVVVAGLLGGRGQGGATGGAGGAGSPEPAAVGASPAAPATTPSTAGPVSRPPGMPDAAFGLPVLTVGQAVDAEELGRSPGLVAVGGYLGFVSTDLSCFPGLVADGGLFCRRELVLGDGPAPAEADPASPYGWRLVEPILRPVAMPGVVIPGPTHPGSPGRSDAPVPAVVLGRFDDPRAGGAGRPWSCPGSGAPCAPPTLTVEWVAWANGVWQDRRTVLGPGLAAGDARLGLTTRRIRESRAMPDSGVLLFEAALRPASLGSIDPAAVAVMPDRPPAIVWYVRAIVGPNPDHGRDVGWLVLDDAGRVLGGWDPATGSGPVP